MTPPHYLCFTRALAIAASLAVPACSSESTSPVSGDASAPAESSDGEHAGSATPPAPAPAKDAGTTMLADSAAPPIDAASEDLDGGGSPAGPLSPPELPAGYAV
jgi:hypothetical protein